MEKNTTIKTTNTTNTIVTNERNAVLDYTATGNGSKYCFECGAEFVTDSAYVEVGKSAAASCHKCGGRCANPNVIGVKEVLTGTWRNDRDGLGDYFLADTGEVFVYAGTDEHDGVFFRGSKERKYLVGVGELLNWDNSITVNSMSGTLFMGQYVTADRDFCYLDRPGKGRPAIVVGEATHNDMYKRYVVAYIE